MDLAVNLIDISDGLVEHQISAGGLDVKLLGSLHVFLILAE